MTIERIGGDQAAPAWSATGGGVRRYIQRIRAWIQKHSDWSHTIISPGVRGVGTIDCGGLPLPAGYRLPSRRDHAATLLAQVQPDLVEVGDPYRLARAALDVTGALQIPAVAFCHSKLSVMAERWTSGICGTAQLMRRSAEAYTLGECRYALTPFTTNGYISGNQGVSDFCGACTFGSCENVDLSAKACLGDVPNPYVTHERGGEMDHAGGKIRARD